MLFPSRPAGKSDVQLIIGGEPARFGAVTGCSLCINGVIEATEAGVRAQADRVLADSSDELAPHRYVVADPRRGR